MLFERGVLHADHIVHQEQEATERQKGVSHSQEPEEGRGE